MDLQSILIGASAFVISAILIYLISVFTMKEKTFEEVLEEQRRRQEEEREKQKSAKKTVKENKKNYRKGKDKPKDKTEKSAAVSDTEVKEHKMVNLEIDPEIIEPVESITLNASNKKSKNKKAKSILVNKDEKSIVSEKQAKEVYHKEITPKDELALHHEHDHHQGKDKQQTEQQVTKAGKHKSETKVEKVREVERVEKERSVRVEKHTETIIEVQRTRAVESENRSARAKGGVPAAEVAVVNGSKLIASVKSANLKDSEVQTLIEILHARQGITSTGSAAEWNKKSLKGDPMPLLKKQLEEKERALQEEQNIAMSANSKVKELRQDLTTEKAKFSSLEKRYQEKIGQQSQDIEAMRARMQQTHQQHLHEVEEMQNQIKQYKASGDRSIIQKLQEEKKILTDTLARSASEKTVSPAEMENLQKKVQIMEKELASNAIKLNGSENSKKSLEQKVAKYEEQLKKHDAGQKDTEVMLSRKMEEVNQELRRAEARNASLDAEKKKAVTDLAKATDAVNNATKEVSTLKSKLQELEKHLSDSDNSKQLEVKLQESDRKRSDLEGNVKNLEKQLSDSQKQRSELETVMNELKQENFALVEEMKTTKERQAGEGQEAPTAPAGAPNGDFHEAKLEKTKVELVQHEKILGEKVQEITRLSTEVQSSKQQISSLQEQLEAQKKKNNEKSQETQQELEAQDKAILQRLFPDVCVKGSMAHKDWMCQFESEAATFITNMSSKSSNSSVQESRIHDLESSNSSLQSDVSHYKQLVTETETKLRQLEKSVESEEKRWKKELQDTQEQLRTSSSRVTQLEQSVSEGRSESEQVKTLLAETEKRLHSVQASSQQKSQDSTDSKEIMERCYQLEVRIGELEDSNSKYEKQVEDYRSVLCLTEEKLTQLEQSAKSEDSKWQEKLKEAEKNLQQSKTEVQTLQEQVKKFRGSTEMEVKVASLESQLKASEERCLVLQKESQEAQTRVVTIQSQLETTKESSDDLEELRRRIKELETSLEGEKKKTKDLSLNVVKLNGIIKTGQDALKQEQDTVKKMQEQLDAKTGGSGSGKEVNEAASPGNDLGTSV